MTAASIALNRFGLGAKPSDPVPADPRRWLGDQLGRYAARPPALAEVPGSRAIAAELIESLAVRQQEKAALKRSGAMAAPPGAVAPGAGAMASQPAAAMPDGAPTMDAMAIRRQQRAFTKHERRDDYDASVGARTVAALTTDAPFVERMVHFWANHFAVSADEVTLLGLAASLEFEAIRPHVLGSFGAMLGAVERHPAMLLYLDQASSIGPDSPFGAAAAARNKRKVGLNENLAREILELHTLGVRSGYSQGDVTEFARALTGWTISGLGRSGAVPTDAPSGTFAFLAPFHQPGDRTIMGKRYPAAGEAQAQAVLDDLAASPATAAHLATKLARHFAGDTPPPALVARLQAAYLKSGGDLPTLYRTLIASPEAWVETPIKFKTPWEWSISVMRALDTRVVDPGVMVGLMTQLGQPVWRPGQPVGYDDIAASWASPDAILRRVEAGERFAGRAGSVDARTLAPKLFPAALSAATAQAIARAESPGQALALLFVSPEMLRR